MFASILDCQRMAQGMHIAKIHTFLKAVREEKTDDVLKSSITLTPKSNKKGLLRAGFLFYDSFSYQNKH